MARLRELLLVAGLCALLLAAQVWLPHDGAGLVVRRIIAVVLTASLVISLGVLVVSAVREFCRGLAEED